MIYDRINELNKLNNDDYITSFIVAYQNVMNMLNALPTVELDVEEELGVLKDMPEWLLYQMRGAKINGVLWTLIEEGIIKEK